MFLNDLIQIIEFVIFKYLSNYANKSLTNIK